jgi:hypothetical protein
LLAHRRGASVTETIRRAIVVLKFVQDEVHKRNKLAVVERDSSGKERVREILLVGYPVPRIARGTPASRQLGSLYRWRRATWRYFR